MPVPLTVDVAPVNATSSVRPGLAGEKVNRATVWVVTRKSLGSKVRYVGVPPDSVMLLVVESMPVFTSLAVNVTRDWV